MRKLILSGVAPAALLALTLSVQPSAAMVRAPSLQSALGMGPVIQVADDEKADDQKKPEPTKSTEQSKSTDKNANTDNQGDQPKKKKSAKRHKTNKQQVMKKIKQYVPTGISGLYPRRRGRRSGWRCRRSGRRRPRLRRLFTLNRKATRAGRGLRPQRQAPVSGERASATAARRRGRWPDSPGSAAQYCGEGRR